MVIADMQMLESDSSDVAFLLVVFRSFSRKALQFKVGFG